jgi:hypothetical protein
MRFVDTKALHHSSVLIILWCLFVSLRNNFVWDDVEVIEKYYYSFSASSIEHNLIPNGNDTKVLLLIIACSVYI